MPKITDRLMHAWNAFMNRAPTRRSYYGGDSYKPDRIIMSRGNERSLVASVINRISMDVAAIDFKHTRLDDDERYVEEIKSNFDECLTLNPNLDQTARAFKQDLVLSMLENGCSAIVPTDTDHNPHITDSYDIQSMRVGKVVEWYPTEVRLELYNEKKGKREEITLPKKMVAIIENPFYSIMNEPNSTMQRIIRKLKLLDVIDEHTGSNKLDLIIQLPYIAKTEVRKQQAEERLKSISDQLSNSDLGIAYIDGTEHVTQLNRSVENNLLKQIEYLTNLFYSQLGITQGILDGTADEKTMLNYQTRVIEPIATAITEELRRKFLTKTARTRGQSILFFRDPFKLVPVNDLAEIADKFTRNEIMTSNEFRQITGLKPSSDPKADQLVNSNINQQSDNTDPNTAYDIQPMDVDDMDSQLNELEQMLSHGDFLQHYASKYYDPEKAHEYYMKNRELKERKSSSGLNEEGKKVGDYVKNQLIKERDNKIDNDKSRTDQNVSSNNSQMNIIIDQMNQQKKASIETEKNKLQSQIDVLKNQLSNMSKEDKAKHRDEIKNIISSLREDSRSIRESISEQYGDEKKSVREETKQNNSELRSGHKETKTQIKEEYDSKIADEMDKIKAEEQYQGTKKSSKSNLDNYRIKK